MLYLLVGDYHGKGLKSLREVVRMEKPDVLISMGDYDRVGTIHDFMEIEDELVSGGKEVVKVAGNHDYLIFNNIQEYTSLTLIEQEKNIRQLHDELMGDPEAAKYISDLINSGLVREFYLGEENFNRDYPAVVLHGSFSSNTEGSTGKPDDPIPGSSLIWARLKSTADHEDNFKSMEQKGSNVMVRGHDHYAGFAVSDNRKISSEEPYPGKIFRIRPGNRYTINPGAFYNGNFATIVLMDSPTHELRVTYRKIGSVTS